MSSTEAAGHQLLTTNRKALVINLDDSRYGTFAEIGAGQEVARHFFQAGGAAGTIAKTMSAYDMAFSDAIYGRCRRYVSEDRLVTMLDHEYSLLQERLETSRGAQSSFFVFADTVAALSYRGNNECHGWLGVRFQSKPGRPPNDIRVHVRMWDRENIMQQQAIGVLGVNLLYAGFYLHEDADGLVRSLVDNLTTDRIEVDVIRFVGPDLEHVDARLAALKLVEVGLTNAVLFGPDGSVQQPSEAFYKKALLVQRGSFHPVTNVSVDMMRCARERLMAEPTLDGREPLSLVEMSMSKLQANGRLDPEDFLARVDTLAALDLPVLVSSDLPYYRLTAYFRRYTSGMIGFAMGARALGSLFGEAAYEKLDGGILEAFGRLFKTNVRLYIYPRRIDPVPAGGTQTGAVLDAIPAHLRHLFDHLANNGLIQALDSAPDGLLGIFARDALRSIEAGTSAWESMVPPAAAAVIRERRLFGLPPA